MITNTCLNCNTEFRLHASHVRRGERHGHKEGRFCGQKCYHEYRKKQTPIAYLTCKFCGKEFTMRKSDADYKSPKFCSYSCNAGYNHPRTVFKRVIKGYNYIYSPDHPNKNSEQMVAEHRLVMEKHVGHYIDRGLHVHHINHVRNDNRIENLQLLTPEQHERAHLEHKRELQKQWWTPERRAAKVIQSREAMLKRLGRS